MNYQSVFAVLLLIMKLLCGPAAAGDFDYALQEDQSICITGYHGDARDVVIPARIDGYPVTAVSGWFTAACDSVTLPDSLTQIGEDGLFWTTKAYFVSPAHPTLSSRDGVLFSKDGTRMLVYPYRDDKVYAVPEGVQTIDGNVSFFPPLQKLILPDSLVSIENGEWGSPVSQCRSLLAIEAGEGSAAYHSEDGVLYDKEMRTLIAYPSGKEQESFSVPSGVERIAPFAFHEARFTHLILPDSVRELGMYLFSNNADLKEAVFEGEGGEALSIGDWVFSGCQDLGSVCLPSRTAQIGEAAFGSHTVIVCASGTYTETWCRENRHACTSLEAEALPDGTLKVYTVMQLGETAVIPSMLDGRTVSTLAEHAFWQYESGVIRSSSSISAVILPEGLTTLCSSAFRGCVMLTQVSLPKSLDRMEGNPFAGCMSLESVLTAEGSPFTVRENLLYEPASGRLICCLHQSGLPEDYTIPEFISELAPRAYDFCGFTAVTIPDHVTLEGDNPFAWCQRLARITVSPDHPTLTVRDGVMYDKAGECLICFPCALNVSVLDVPRGVRSIGPCAAGGYNQLTEVMLPESVTELGEEAFAYCTKLETINLPEGLVSIGDWAFEMCESLHRIVLPSSLRQLGITAFISCSSLEQIEVNEGLGEIPYAAFSGCAVSEIVLPQSMTVLGGYAFSGCGQLERAVLPAGITQIGPLVFQNCPRVMVTVEPDSCAAQYCRDNGLKYTYPEHISWPEGD